MTETAKTKPPVRDFEDLISFQQARELHKLVDDACDGTGFRARATLAQQIRDASASVMANLAEGFGRGYRGHLHHAICLAKGSCAEVRSHAIACFDEGLIDQPTFEAVRAKAQRVEALLGGFRRAVAANRGPEPSVPEKRDAD
ncbi:MAG TPA: four helix bundle protein [Gemmatimonadales bacterium]|nr:four helix bundle protein [Gemmatimonadales bacterium]